MKIEKKGFTLVELLTTLVILSILMTVAITGFTSYINRSNKTYYEDLENTTKNAVMDFFADNRNYYPKQVGKSREINLQDLIDKKYIESIVDIEKKNCTGKAVVVKKGSNQYEYKVCITCPSRSEKIGNGC